MKEVTIKSKIVGRGGASAATSPGKGVSVDMSGYLLKQIWEKVFEFRLTDDGTEYLFAKMNVAAQGGFTSYVDGGKLDLPSIFDGLIIDNDTIYWEKTTHEDGSVTKILKSKGGEGGGLGFVVLGNGDVLSDKLVSENTIYEVKGNFDLKGEEIHIPSGSTLFFTEGSVSNGTVVFDNTLLYGIVSFGINCKFLGKVRNDALFVDWFGAKNDGVSDNTEAIRNVIHLAYNSMQSTTDDFSKRSPVIKFGHGVYIVNSSLINEDDDLKYGSFTFEGSGLVSTVIGYKGASDTWLFNNKNIFAYTSFRNLRFYGTDYNNFMYLESNVSLAIAQSFTFENCRFGQFKTCFRSEGDAMTSEVSFLNCKFVYFPNRESRLFIFNNLQSVNWRFFGTDIEQTHGVVFDIRQGTYISLYSSSIIPIQGTIITVSENVKDGTFWDTNTPNIAMYSCRFEMRGDSRLLYVYTQAYLQFVFNTCSLGGRNIGSSTSSYQIDIDSPTGINQTRLTFNDCSNFANYRFKIAGSENSYLGYVSVYFNNCIVPLDEMISRSSIPTLYNSEGMPKFYKDGVCVPYNARSAKRHRETAYNYLLKSESDDNFNSRISAGSNKRYDTSNFVKINSYVGAIAFNVRPTTDIRLYIYNSAQDYIYADFTIKANTEFRQSVPIGKLITESDYVIVMVYNLSESSSCIITGHAEVMNTFVNSNLLMSAERLSSLQFAQNGLMAYNNTYNMPVVWDGTNSVWRDGNGFRTIGKHRGTLNERPTPNSEDVGYFYFDSTDKKPYWWIGNGWVTTSSGGGADTTADFIPSSDNSYDIGNENNRWKDVHLGGDFYSPFVYIRNSNQNNPLIRLTNNTLNWYLQAESSYLYLGATSSKALRLDVIGNAYLPGTLTQVSDIRYKNVHKELQLSLDEMADAPCFEYDFKEDVECNAHVGTSAQYWQNVEGVVREDENGKLGMDYSSLGVVMGISLAKELRDAVKQIEVMKKEIEALKSK